MVLPILRFLKAAWVMAYYSANCFVRLPFQDHRKAWLQTHVRWGVGILRAVKVDWVIHNPERLIRPSIFVCNHQSFLDVVLLPAMLPPEKVFIAKQEIAKIPVFGHAFATTGAVMIDRSNPRGAIESIRAGVAKLPKDWSIVIFPEGTRSRTGELKHFKKGCIHLALGTKYPIVPIAVHGIREVTPSPSWLPRPGTVHIAVGEPIDTTSWTFETIDEHLVTVRNAVAQELERARAAWTAGSTAR